MSVLGDFLNTNGDAADTTALDFSPWYGPSSLIVPGSKPTLRVLAKLKIQSSQPIENVDLLRWSMRWLLRDTEIFRVLRPHRSNGTKSNSHDIG